MTLTSEVYNMKLNVALNKQTNNKSMSPKEPKLSVTTS